MPYMYIYMHMTLYFNQRGLAGEDLGAWKWPHAVWRAHERINKLSILLTARLHWNEAALSQNTSAHLLNIKHGHLELSLNWLGKLFMNSNCVAWNKLLAQGYKWSPADRRMLTLFPRGFCVIPFGPLSAVKCELFTWKLPTECDSFHYSVDD